MINIPQEKRWSQHNSGDVFGILHGTKNINFDKEGYVQLAKRPTALFYNVSKVGLPVSISYMKATSGTGYYMMTDDTSASGGPFTFALDGAAPSTVYDGTVALGNGKNDALVFNGKWVVSQSTGYAYYTGAAWSALKGSLTTYDSTTAGHPMAAFESLNYLAIGDYNTVKLYDTSDVLQGTLTIPVNFEVKWLRYNNQRLYIGTKNKTGGKAVMFVWDGTGSAAQSAWPVPANWMWSGVIYKDSICTCISTGQLLRFNGGGWDELANFPVYYSNYAWYQGSGYVNGRMEQRGMATDGHVLYLNIDGYVGDNNVYLENQPSGLWVYDPPIGLYHRAGFSNDKLQKIAFSSVSAATDVITATATFTALTGVKVFYNSSATVMGGLFNNRYYYMIQVSTSTFKLATTYANAIAGTAVDITSSGSGTQTFSCCNELDAGASLETTTQPGAIALISELDANPVTYGYMTGSQVLFGAKIIPQDGGVPVYTLQTLTPGYNRGYIVTQKIFSPNIIESWGRIIAKCNRIFQTSDKMIVKYRVIDKAYYPISLTNDSSVGRAVFTSGTVFTSTADLSSVVAGEEVEFTSGRGAGLTAHIVSITVNAGTYTVTLDETIPGVVASDKAGFVVQNWLKIGVVNSSTPNSMLDVTLTPSSKWIQLKLEIRGHSEPIIEEAKVSNSAYKKAA